MSDQRPFEDIIAEHGAVVMRVCRALLDRADAEDAWAETFLAALRAYPRLRPGSNVQAWLVTIAHRRSIDQIRATTRAPRPTDAVPERVDGAPVESVPDPDLWSAVAALPDRQRTAVVYHYVAGLPYAEIAELTDTTTAAARRSAADGIATLRKHHRGEAS